MNYNNNCSPQQNSPARTYEPFMLGESYGVGVSASAPGLGSSRNPRGRRECVQDCLLWGNTTQPMGNAASLGGGNDGFYNSMNSIPFNVIPQPTYNPGKSQGGQYQYQQPKAFVSVPGGEGSRSGAPVSIPCQIAPLGTNPASLIQPMEPISLRVTAPAPSMNQNGGRNPLVFTINPQQLFGGGRQ